MQLFPQMLSAFGKMNQQTIHLHIPIRWRKIVCVMLIIFCQNPFPREIMKENLSGILRGQFNDISGEMEKYALGASKHDFTKEGELKENDQLATIIPIHRRKAGR